MPAPEFDTAPGPRSTPEPRVGYVLKMYPRFSETFILNEILALEELGTELEIFSLRPPADGRFHESLAEVRAAVTYLPHRLRADALWATLRHSRPALPELGDHLDELLAADPDVALAAVEIAVSARAHQITHLHAHFGSVAATVARLAGLLAGIGYSFTAHAKDIFHHDVDPADLRRKLADARAVVTVSDFNVTHLRDTFGPAADSVVRVYNGLDLRRFGRHRLGERTPVISAVGRLVEKKGFADLVDAIALLAAERPDVRLDLVGTGPEEDALREQVQRLGLTERVSFLGALPQARVRDVVRRSAVFAAPCVVGADGNRDGLPTVLLEALAAGTPSVATPVTGIPEAIRHEQTGLQVPESSPRELAGALARLLDDPRLAERLADAGRQLVEEEFDIRRNARQLHELFTRCSNHSSAPRGPVTGERSSRVEVPA